MTDQTLTRARSIADQPTSDRLDGLRGEEAHEVIAHLLESAGLTYLEAIRLLGAYGWSQWHAGWNARSKSAAVIQSASR